MVIKDRKKICQLKTPLFLLIQLLKPCFMRVLNEIIDIKGMTNGKRCSRSSTKHYRLECLLR